MNMYCKSYISIALASLIAPVILATSSNVAIAKGNEDNPAIVVIDQTGSNNDVDAKITNDSSNPVPITGDIEANVTGNVSVTNLPLDETSNSLLTMSSGDNLRDGGGRIDLSNNRDIAIPEGVAMTDVYIQRDFTSDDDTCWIYFYYIEGGAFHSHLSLFPSADDPLVELHFEGGVRSTASREIGFFMNADCSAQVFWAGYEY